MSLIVRENLVYMQLEDLLSEASRQGTERQVPCRYWDWSEARFH